MAKHAKSASERLSNPRNVQFKRDLSHLEKLILRSTQKFNFNDDVATSVDPPPRQRAISVQLISYNSFGTKRGAST